MKKKASAWFKRFLAYLKKFLTHNSNLLKAVRTLLEVAAAWAISMLPQWLSGMVLPPELQVAVIGVFAASIAAIAAELGDMLPDEETLNAKHAK